MSSISKRRKEGSKAKIKTLGDHDEFLKRITKTLYYGELPNLPCLSLPVTEISCELWSVSQQGRSLRRLRADAAAEIGRSACVSPCALVLAILYLERLKRCNKDYLAAAAPADLFLVSLMVSNKFLQDDGEDDEVICSEWAASGGLELEQLKKLEVQFLSAIDWNVYVNERSFEAGLSWLERQVALRQALGRGFFTYGDLAASCDHALAAAAASALAHACAALASLLALLTSALLVSHTCLNALPPRPASPASPAADTNIMTRSPSMAHSRYPSNATLDRLPHLPSLEDDPPLEMPKCCTKWLHYQNQERANTKKSWYDTVVVYDWKSFEPWWCRSSLLNWLYHSSLIDPMQRWLERFDEFASLFRKKLFDTDSAKPPSRCHEYVDGDQKQHCVRQWLNLSKLSVFMASISDR